MTQGFQCGTPLPLQRLLSVTTNVWGAFPESNLEKVVTFVVIQKNELPKISNNALLLLEMFLTYACTASWTSEMQLESLEIPRTGSPTGPGQRSLASAWGFGADRQSMSWTRCRCLDRRRTSCWRLCWRAGSTPLLLVPLQAWGTMWRWSCVCQWQTFPGGSCHCPVRLSWKEGTHHSENITDWPLAAI